MGNIAVKENKILLSKIIKEERFSVSVSCIKPGA